MKDDKFEWDNDKNYINAKKHGVIFDIAKKAFYDKNRVIMKDPNHPDIEMRMYCIGYVDGEVITVRYIMRNKRIRIFGAGYWRQGKQIYEKQKKNIH